MALPDCLGSALCLICSFYWHFVLKMITKKLFVGFALTCQVTLNEWVHLTWWPWKKIPRCSGAYGSNPIGLFPVPFNLVPTHTWREGGRGLWKVGYTSLGATELWTWTTFQTLSWPRLHRKLEGGSFSPLHSCRCPRRYQTMWIKMAFLLHTSELCLRRTENWSQMLLLFRRPWALGVGNHRCCWRLFLIRWQRAWLWGSCCMCRSLSGYMGSHSAVVFGFRLLTLQEKVHVYAVCYLVGLHICGLLLFDVEIEECSSLVSHVLSTHSCR